MKGPSPGGNDRWEKERYRQWEKEYADWYNKYYKGYDNQHPSMHHKGRGSRDREKDRMSPLNRDYSPQGRGRRGREERGAPPHHPQSSSSSAAKSSSKLLKTKKVKKKRTGDESESSHQSVDRGDATPVRDEPMDDVPSLLKSPPSSSKASAGAASSKAASSKGAASKPSTKSTSKTPSDKTKKDKALKVKAKVKTEGVKVKTEKVKKKTVEAVVSKKKDSSSSSSSSATKPLKTVKPKQEDAPNPTTPKKEKSKSSAVRPPLLKTPPLSSLHHPSLHDGLRQGHDIHGRRDLPQGGGLLPLPHHHGLPLLLHRPPSPDSRRRMGDEGRSILGPPPGKLRRIDGLGGGVDVMSHSHMSHQPPLHRLPHSDRPGLLPIPGSREMGRGEAERGSIRPLMDLQVGLSETPGYKDLFYRGYLK